MRSYLYQVCIICITKYIILVKCSNFDLVYSNNNLSFSLAIEFWRFDHTRIFLLYTP